MGRTKRAAVDTEESAKDLDAKSKAIEKAKARISREKAQKSYREPSDSEASEKEFAGLKNEDKDFSGDEDPSEEDSGSEWDGQSSGSEYGKKKKKVVAKGGAKGRGRGRVAGRKSASASPKKGGKGRGRGRPSASASASAKNGKKAPAKRARDASDESESEAESSGSEFGKKKASPAKKATPARGRASAAAKAKKASPAPASDSNNSRARRGRPAKTKSYKELSEDEELEVSEEEKKPVSKRAKLDVEETKTKVTPKKDEKKEKVEKDEDSEDADEEMKSEDEDEVEKKPVKKANGSAPKDEKKNEPDAKKESKIEDDDEEDDDKVEDKKSDAERKIKEKSPASSEGGDSLGGKSDDGGLKNKTDTDYSKIDFSCDKKTPKGEEWNFKISLWNVSGIRSWLKKNGLEYLKKENPDVMCLNEIKCDEKSKPEKFDGYPHTYWSYNSENSGQSGVAILSKVEPKSVQYGLPVGESDAADEKKLKESFNKEGRLITVEYDNFYLINAYVPNGGKTEKSDEYPKGYPVKVANGIRLKFDTFFKAFIKSLEEKKPVVIAGDLNVAHNEIDLANPKSNDKSAGFTKEERDNFTELLKEANLVDSFRALNPDKKGAYTYWTYRANCREKNVGWRLDYFLLSEKIRDSLCENAIRSDVYGSDHCPIVLFMKN